MISIYQSKANIYVESVYKIVYPHRYVRGILKGRGTRALSILLPIDYTPSYMMDVQSVNSFFISYGVYV